jgi:ribonuclease P protein component
MRRSADFSATVRTGRQARRGSVVVHHDRSAAPPRVPALVGFIVGKSVGGSVVRHRTSRRLRAAMSAHLDQLPSGSATVVRALPPAALASSADLAADLDAALERVVVQ